MVEHRVSGVEFSDLPCLASGQNSNLTSDDMVDICHKGINVDGENEPAPENITDKVPPPVNTYNQK